MNHEIERNLGEQPIVQIMAEHGLRAPDLVSASTEQITHKMVARACKGRRLTANSKGKVCRALNACTERPYAMAELFTY
ncbi:MAG: hypothetical protein HN742_36465 [Lentisphaerae bacterium]|jgi:hypothetical protein|nr:hypothetical protein [Lentisphaerota bacterium]MBT4820127.1 hypothetical protein [Lentisphaerota bacterium]MBT5604440.1 hypothetical protein [Lentisphaerota bacterium]MBT7058197.1 hypothetical protein [Lentisphaerota bacterium]MBT7847419.1 hypothetical protein [Lentisphaerota bacterium]